MSASPLHLPLHLHLRLQRLQHLQSGRYLALTPWLKGLGLLVLAVVFGAISVLYANAFNTRHPVLTR